MYTALILLGLIANDVPTPWPKLVQAPYETLATPDIGLQPLLIDGKGQAIVTPDGWQRRRLELLALWNERLGKAPQKPDSLEVKTESEEKLDGYRRQLVEITTEGEDRLRAWLLTPEGIRPGEKRAAVVVFHETTRNTFDQPIGKEKVTDYAMALHLVKRGYVTLSPECYILKDPKGWARGQAAALAKRRPGWTGMGKMTFDGSRCVDFLESLPTVNATRIGCIGHSLGAKEVLYCMAFEPRFRVGVSSEGGVGLRMSNWFDAWYLTERMKPHVPAFEHHQVLALCAPRPILVVAGDDADGDRSWAFVKAARPVYRLLGVGDRIGLYNHHKKHTFPTEAQNVAYRWLGHWLGFGAK